MSVNAAHAYMPGSHTPGMMENIAITYSGIEWFYIEGNIKYDDDWSRRLVTTSSRGKSNWQADLLKIKTT